MYSRDFSDRGEGRMPPEYHGTALGGRHRGADEERGHRPPPKEPPPKEAPCDGDVEPREEAGAPGCDERPKGAGAPLLGRFLPAGVDTGDLLLLGLAILLLSDGCEDEFLPLILLFLLIVN
ncbi:MAG: hypothetical protein IJF73_07085 [Clostridia bacterium]|nr:hypothetical protein [Clostridia bacterium]